MPAFVRHSDSLQRVTAGERWGVLFLVLLYKYIGPLAHRPPWSRALPRGLTPTDMTSNASFYSPWKVPPREHGLDPESQVAHQYRFLFRGGGGGGKRRTRAVAPASVVSAAWALASVGAWESDLWEVILEFARERLSDFTPRDLGDIGWACTTAGILLPDSYKDEIKRKMKELEPADLANVGWALACQLGSAAVARPVVAKELALLSDLLAREVDAKLGQMQSSAFGQVIWSLGRLGALRPSVCARASDFLLRHVPGAEASVRGVHEAEPDAIAETLWAMSVTGFAADELFAGGVPAALEIIRGDERALMSLRPLSPRGLSLMVRAAGELCWADIESKVWWPQLVQRACWEDVRLGNRGMTDNELVDTAWGLVVAHSGPMRWGGGGAGGEGGAGGIGGTGGTQVCGDGTSSATGGSGGGNVAGDSSVMMGVGVASVKRMGAAAGNARATSLSLVEGMDGEGGVEGATAGNTSVGAGEEKTAETEEEKGGGKVREDADGAKEMSVAVNLARFFSYFWTRMALVHCAAVASAALT